MLNYLLPTLAALQQQARQLNASTETRAAVHLALWLIIEKGEPRHRAVRVSAKKKGATQTATLAGVKAIIPPEYFHDRQRSAAATMTGRTPRDKFAHLNQPAQRHMKEITQEDV